MSRSRPSPSTTTSRAFEEGTPAAEVQREGSSDDKSDKLTRLGSEALDLRQDIFKVSSAAAFEEVDEA